MARWSPKPEVSQVLACGQGPHCSQHSLGEEGRAPGPLVVPGVSSGESILSGTKPNQLRRRDPPSPPSFLLPGRVVFTVSVICLCISHGPGRSLVLP